VGIIKIIAAVDCIRFTLIERKVSEIIYFARRTIELWQDCNVSQDL
jgi:hypothetical protein